MTKSCNSTVRGEGGWQQPGYWSGCLMLVHTSYENSDQSCLWPLNYWTFWALDLSMTLPGGSGGRMTLCPVSFCRLRHAAVWDSPFGVLCLSHHFEGFTGDGPSMVEWLREEDLQRGRQIYYQVCERSVVFSGNLLRAVQQSDVRGHERKLIYYGAYVILCITLILEKTMADIIILYSLHCSSVLKIPRRWGRFIKTTARE